MGCTMGPIYVALVVAKQVLGANSTSWQGDMCRLPEAMEKGMYGIGH